MFQSNLLPPSTGKKKKPSVEESGMNIGKGKMMTGV
jgi:hypothetical protein